MLRIIALLFLSLPTLSFALGLGELELKSNLGEPFSAKVMVTDIDATAPDISCFSAADNNEPPAFKKAHVSIKNISGNYQLSVTTHEVINEPIVNLRITIHCEPNLNREYVLLLDPAPISRIEKATTPIPQTPSSQTEYLPKHKSQSHKSQTQTLNQDTTTPSAEDSSPNNVSKKKKKKKNLSAKPSVNDSLTEAYVGKQQTIKSKPAPEMNVESKHITSNASVDKPRLIISGNSDDSTANTPALSLRLETQLDLNRTEIAPAPLTAADAADEMTVMTNRLAHLEKQLVGLQTQNALLRSEVEKTKSVEQNSLFNLENNLPIILSILAIASIISAGVWLRRKAIRNSLFKKHDNWFNVEKNELPDSLPKIDAPVSDENIFGETSTLKSNSDDMDDSHPSNPAQGGFSPYPTAFTVTESDNSENVLDHAEVFLAHDRPAMAIQLLQNHLVDLPVESPEIWLKLINLLATEGTEAEYENAATACKQFFNVKLPKFANASIEDTSSIEDYPHIVTKLQEVWKSDHSVDYLNDLIFNRKSQPREGFGRKTFEDLFFLKQMAILLTPKKSNTPKSDSTVSSTAKTENADVTPLEKTDASQIETNYGMTISTEPMIHTAPAHDVATTPDKLTAEAFLNAPEANELELSFTDMESANVTHNKPLQTAPAQTTSNVDTTLKAEEIDFSDFLNEATTGSAPELLFPETSTQSEALTLDAQDSAAEAQDLPQATLDIEPKETNEKTRKAPLSIEWELPKLDS